MAKTNKKMIKTSKEISIKEDNIFENDLLDRKEAITDLSQLIENQEEALVLSVNADWGAGKTTFVRLWKTYLKTQGIESIYFSAWNNDFSNEPLVAILGELNIYIESLDKKQTKFKKVKKIGDEIIKKSLPIIAKGLVAKVIGNDAVSEISEISEIAAKTLINDYQANKSDLKELKESIAKVLEAINPDKPFVIFIDELDRCKPLYAIELLERIKHIFDIERLIFVLSMDKKNLAKSIQSQYGNIDTDNYLRRFIHLEYPLKNPSVDKFCKVLFHQQFELPTILNLKITNYGYEYDLDLIQKFSTIFNLSLRQIEQLFTKLHIFFNTMLPEFRSPHFTIFILFECLKSHDEKRYYNFLSDNIDEEKIKEIKDIVLKKYNGNKSMRGLIEVIIDMTPLRNDEKAQKNYIENQTDEYCKNSLQHFQNIMNYGLESHINTVIKHINFTNKFDFNTNK